LELQEKGLVVTEGVAPGATVLDSELKAGALKLPAVLMQSVTMIAPAIGILFGVQPIVSLAGVTAPIAYLVGLLIVLTLGVTLAQLAEKFPSAGGYFTYLSRTIHPRVGFMVGWLFMLNMPLAPGPIMAYMGVVLEGALKTQFGFDLPWWVFFLAGTAFVGVIVYRGIEVSGKALMILGSIEIVVVGALSFWGFFNPGPGGVSVQSFSPAHAGSGIFLAIIGAIFVYTGWEGTGSVAEESENPRRNVPIAVMASIIFLGIFTTLCVWGLLTGWGIANVSSFVSSPVSPPIVLAHRYWGGFGIIAVLVLINSTIAVCIAVSTVATRMWYAMARAGCFPSTFQKIHPVYKTPVNAIWLQLACFFVLGLGGALLVGLNNVWFVSGLVTTFALIFIYDSSCIGLFWYMWRERRSEFNWLVHGLVPAIGVLGLIGVGYNSVVPFPSAPFSYAPVIVAIWFVLGVVVLVAMKSRGREDWLLKAGAAMAEVPAHE
jgi:amino acid transporter